MLEVFQFIFSSFWVWLGTVILIGAASSGFANIIASITGRYNKNERGED